MFVKLSTKLSKRNFGLVARNYSIKPEESDLALDEEDLKLTTEAYSQNTNTIDDKFWSALSKYVSTKKTTRIWSQTFYKGKSVPGPLYGISTSSQWVRDKAAEFFDYKECVMTHSIGEESELPRLRTPEFAFAGRSNVGKSSLINAMVSGPACVTSSTPGRTRRLNMFSIRNTISVVDLPGYGYAEGNPELIEKWVDLLRIYLTKRSNLQKVYHLLDPRYDLFETDKIFLDTMKRHGVMVQFVLTKCDEISHETLYARMEALYKVCDKEPMVAPIIIPTSSKEMCGIDELQAQTIIGSGLLERKYFLSHERAQKEFKEENEHSKLELKGFQAKKDKFDKKKQERKKRILEKYPDSAQHAPKHENVQTGDPALLKRIKKQQVVLGLDDNETK